MPTGQVYGFLLAATLVIVLGLGLGFRPDGGVAGVLAAVALILVFAFSLRGPGRRWAGPAGANAVNNVALLVLFPLTLASNVFVDPQTMPGWLQAFVDVNPISHLVTAERGLMHGTAATAEVGWVLLASAALTAVFAPLTMHLYRRRQ